MAQSLEVPINIFMKLKTILPYSQWKYKLSGVYKITFEDGSFYIGSSKHLRSRAFAWEAIFRKKKGVAGVNIGTAIIEKIREDISAILEIIELCNSNDIRDREAFYLEKDKDNPKMLSDNERGGWVSILQYKKDGLFIKKHYSISAAARYIGSTMSSIQRVLNGEKHSCKGMVFVYEHDYHERRKRIIRGRSKKVIERKRGRMILMMDDAGNILMQFKTIVEAARHIGRGTGSVTKTLNGFQKTSAGYKFKYANFTTTG